MVRNGKDLHLFFPHIFSEVDDTKGMGRQLSYPYKTVHNLSITIEIDIWLAQLCSNKTWMAMLTTNVKS